LPRYARIPQDAPVDAWRRQESQETPRDAMRRQDTPGCAWKRLQTPGDAWRHEGTLGDARERLETPGDPRRRQETPGNGWRRQETPVDAKKRLETQGAAWKRLETPGDAWRQKRSKIARDAGLRVHEARCVLLCFAYILDLGAESLFGSLLDDFSMTFRITFALLVDYSWNPLELFLE
jgi:hypothetical protein